MPLLACPAVLFRRFMLGTAGQASSGTLFKRAAKRTTIYPVKYVRIGAFHAPCQLLSSCSARSNFVVTPKRRWSYVKQSHASGGKYSPAGVVPARRQNGQSRPKAPTDVLLAVPPFWLKGGSDCHGYTGYEDMQPVWDIETCTNTCKSRKFDYHESWATCMHSRG